MQSFNVCVKYYSGKFELFKAQEKYIGDSQLRCRPTFSVQSLATEKATSMKTYRDNSKTKTTT